MALELNIPVIISSQLFRFIDEIENKRPTLDDIRGTGIQSNSDKIVCLYSNDYYNNVLFHQ